MQLGSKRPTASQDCLPHAVFYRENVGRPPAAGAVRAPFPARPLISVSGREPRAEKSGDSGPVDRRRQVRFALHSPQSLYPRFQGANPRPKNPVIAVRPTAAGRCGSRSIPRKAFNLGFRARTPGRLQMEKCSTEVSRRPPCCTFHSYNPERKRIDDETSGQSVSSSISSASPEAVRIRDSSLFLASQWEVAMLAPCSPQSLIPSSSHANIARVFPACRHPCWRLVPLKALFLRPVTPTWPGFSRPAAALVGALFSARPYSFARSRQHGSVFPGFPAPLLAPCSPQGLIPSSSHANIARVFPACRRPCWRLIPRKALSLRRATPTWPGFSRPAGALVGALFPARPYSFVKSRQHGPNFPGLPAPMLAPYSPQGLIPSSGHANIARFFPACRHPCWRLVPRKEKPASGQQSWLADGARVHRQAVADRMQVFYPAG